MAVEARAALDQGLAQAGTITARNAQRVQLLGADTTGWTLVLWSIKSYPEAFALPPGWTLNSETGAYESTSIRPPGFHLPNAAEPAKLDIDLTVDGVTDSSLRIVIPSGTLRLVDMALGESTTRSGFRGFVRDHNRNLRLIERAVSAFKTPGIVSTTDAGLASRITEPLSAFQADADGVPFWGPLSAEVIRPSRLPNNYGALGLWHFDGNLLDSSGYGRNLAILAGIERYSQIWPGMRAVHLNGSTSLVYNVADAALRLTEDMTVTFIIYLLTATYSAGPIFSHGIIGDTGASGNYLYDIEIISGPKVEWFQEFPTQQDSFADFVDLPPVWPCVLTYVRYDGGTHVAQYVNGQAWGTPVYNAGSALTVPSDGTAGRLRFGSSAGFPPPMFLAGAKLDGRALTADEIKADYNESWGRAFGTI